MNYNASSAIGAKVQENFSPARLPDCLPGENRLDGAESTKSGGHTHKPFSPVCLTNSKAIISEDKAPRVMREDLSKMVAQSMPGKAYVYGDAEARDRRRLELAAGVNDYSDYRLMTVLGALNFLLFHAANCWGAIIQIDGEGLNPGQRIIVNREKFLELIELDRPVAFRCALISHKAYLEEWWPDASHNINLIRELMDDLRDMGLLDYYSEQGNGRRSRIYTGLDIPSLLLLAEVIEKIIGYDNLPDHKAATLQKLYNALFPGWGYNREGEPDSPEPEDYEQSLSIRQERSWQFWQGARAAFQKALETYHHFCSLFGPDDPLTIGALQDGRTRYGPEFGAAPG